MLSQRGSYDLHKAAGEKDIKASVIQYMVDTGLACAGDMIASELVIAGTRTRVDLAICGREFIGIEIKSSLDTIRRLRSQVEAYRKLFDRVIVVLADKHASQDIGWQDIDADIWTIDSKGAIDEFRKQPSKSLGCVENYIQMLTVSDLKKIVPRNRYVRPNRICLSDAAKTLTFDELRTALLVRLKHRFFITSGNFWAEIAQIGKCDVHSLRHLSRFADQRTHFSKVKATQAQIWHDWDRDFERLSI